MKTTSRLLLFLFLFGSSAIVYAKGKKPPENAPRGETVAKPPENQAAQSSVPNPPQVSALEPQPQIKLRDIGLEEAKQLFDQGSVVFIDGRSRSAYDARHIKGALSCSMGEFELQLSDIKNKVPLSQPLVVYCSGESCRLAEKIGVKLVQNGYTNVAVFSPGWPAWAQANYPAEP